MNISYSFGMVDLLHYGHIVAMKQASEGADLKIYGLVSDASSDAWFGTHVSNEDERRAVVEGIKYIDEVWPQTTFDPIDNLRTLHAQYPEAVISLFTGNEWGVISAKKYVESIGGKVVKLDYYDKLSPQAILEKLNESVATSKRPNNMISTKANTLLALSPVITKARIEKAYVVTAAEYFGSKDSITKEIKDSFETGSIVVRSSSKREDAYEESNAGHFVSILDVDVTDTDAIKRAIDSVYSSYGNDYDDDEQVLVQRQTCDVLISGVVFTRDIQRNRPYYVISYDESGDTESVTSGKTCKQTWIANNADRDSIPEKWKKLMEAVWELEDLLSGILLDIEFAITDSSVVIFQVRPLAAAIRYGRNNDHELVNNSRASAKRNYKKFAKNGLRCFSDMAFWNPAEIIGDNPYNMDYSLYREIITKSAWDKGLVPMGYRPVNKELMYRFGNKPYISVELSLEALMPAGISEELSQKLMDYYMDKLKKNPSAHDKIEFEISHNCFDFSLHERLGELFGKGFTGSEVVSLEDSLKTLTLKVIDSYRDVLDEDLRELNRLEGVRLDVQNMTNNCKDIGQLVKSIKVLTDAIVNYGTVQFSRQARCAFIAKSILRSLSDKDYISAEDYNNFLSSIETVAVDYDRDFKAVNAGKESQQEFFLKYGHLRSGTYNIRNLRYDQRDDLFAGTEGAACDNLKNSNGITEVESGKPDIRALDELVAKALTEACKGADFDIDVDKTISFIRESTKQREYFKFVFTKSLSFVLELIKKIGGIAGIEPSDLSYLELAEVYATEFYSNPCMVRDFWNMIISKRKDYHEINSQLILPEIIFSVDDFECVEYVASRPNYITENCVTGNVVVLDKDDTTDLDGKIVVIEKADPGYDWIFSKGLIGLITKYGGAASHMAIRCAEFSVPAAIGVGNVLYEYALGCNAIAIDCKNGKITKAD